MLIKIEADFNQLTIDRSRVQLNGDYLPEGLLPDVRVLLFEIDDFEVEAVIEKVYLKDNIEIWYGVLDWDTIRYTDNKELP
jgi:hypothetical protein